MQTQRRTGARLLLAALVASLVHAVPSLYWATGGDLGVESLGEWAPAWRDSSPALAGAALVGIFLVKAAGGVVPLLATRRLLPRPRLWRALSWAGAAVLVAWGGANVVVGGLALAGVITGPADDVALQALAGHVLFWDPVFLLWGLLLAGGLFLTRTRPVRAAPETRAFSVTRG